MGHSLVIFAAAWLASLTTILAAEPPQAIPTQLPTSPAEVAEILEQTDVAEARLKELIAQRYPTRNAVSQAVSALRSGPFKAAGGWDHPEFKRLSATAAELDAQLKLKREAMATADSAGNKDERAALEIEHQRLRVRKDAAQTAVDAFIVLRCRALPDGKAAAENAQALVKAATQVEREIESYGNIVANWRDVASAYRQRQKPTGFELTKVRELTLPPPADADRRLAEFAARNDAAHTEALAHRLFRSLDPTVHGLEKPFTLYRQKQFAAALDTFRDYFFDKLANLEKYGVPADAVLTDERPPLGTPVIQPEWVQDAMRGVATQPNRFVSANELLRISVGEPGAVNWAHVPAEPVTAQKMPVWLQVMRQFHILERDGGDATDGLRCWLIDAYQVTGETKYLQRWAAYADDWALNMQRDLNSLQVEELPAGTYDPVAIRRDARQAPYRWNVRWYPTLIARQMPQFVTRLRALVLTHPGTAREFPAATLARVLLVGLDEYLSPNILVARATRFNWNMMGLSFNVRNHALACARHVVACASERPAPVPCHLCGHAYQTLQA